MTAQVRWFDATQIRIARVQAEKIELLALQFPVLTETLLADWSFSGRINHPPVFAPDGDRVLLAAYTPQITNLEIYQFQPGANDILNLSNRRSHNDSLPEWSPDGSRIAYRMSGDGQQTILVMNADGSDHRILWQERSTTISNLRWSADGQRIAYVRLQPGQSALCILALIGSEPDCSFRGYAFRSVEWKPFG